MSGRIGFRVRIDTRPAFARLLHPKRALSPRHHRWVRNGNIILPDAPPRAVCLAASGSGKTNLLLQIAQAALAKHWDVVVLDCKGSSRDVPAWREAGLSAGLYPEAIKVFPNAPWRLWTGVPTVDVSIAAKLVPVGSDPVFSERLVGLLHELAGNEPHWSNSDELLAMVANPQRYIQDPLALRAVTGRLSGQTANAGALSDMHAALSRLKGKEDQLTGFNWDDDFRLAIVPLPVSADVGMQRLGAAMLSALDAWTKTVNRSRPLLVIVDEAAALIDDPTNPPFTDLLEQMRSSGAGLILCGQSMHSLGVEAEQLLNSGADIIGGHLPDGEALSTPVGTHRVPESTAKDSGTRPSSASSSRWQDTYLLHPNYLRRLAPGFFVIISGHRAIGCLTHQTPTPPSSQRN